MTDRRWAWVEVDLTAIRDNLSTLMGLTHSGTRCMAVVKADAYGHGAVPVARTAVLAGASRLGVATVDEGIELRQAGITVPIHLLSEPPVTAIDDVLEFDLIPAVTTMEFAKAAGERAMARGQVLNVHLKVDTGMGRIGVRAEEAPRFALRLLAIRGLALEGTFTHFATADVPGDWDFSRQLSRFEATIAEMRTEDIDPGIVHAANSAATMTSPKAHFDMVRLGIAMYGIAPSSELKDRMELRPAMAVKAQAILVKGLPLGEGVSYGLTYRATPGAAVATLGLGYADGLHRVLSNRMSVLFNGMRLRQVGRICMDQCMVEIPRGVTAQRGDEFVLVGRQSGATIRMEDLADAAGTIGYEMACAFGQRMERIYPQF